MTFEIFAQVFLRCVHTFSIYSEGKKKKEKRKTSAVNAMTQKMVKKSHCSGNLFYSSSI